MVSLCQGCGGFAIGASRPRWKWGAGVTLGSVSNGPPPRAAQSRAAPFNVMSAEAPASPDAAPRDDLLAHRLREALWASGEWVWEWRAADNRIRVDRLAPGASTPRDDLGPDELMARADPEDQARLRQAWQAHLSGQTPVLDVQFRAWVQAPGGVPAQPRQWRWLRVRGQVVEQAPAGQPQRVLGTVGDVTEARSAEARLREAWTTDALTGLPNRVAAQQRLQQALAEPAPAMGVALLEVDGVKELNESFGHDAVDGLLAEVAQCLKQLLPADAWLARWAGNEFVVLLGPGSGDTEVRALAQAVLAALASGFEVSGLPVTLAPTLGAVLVPTDGTDAGALMRRCHLALQAGKDRGGRTLVFFDPSLDVDLRRRVRMAALLRVDTDRNNFGFVAQSKVDEQGNIIGSELLMRWNAEGLGAVSPAEFIPLAERVGLIQLMGRHAAHAAARLAADCQGLDKSLPVAVNLSPRQLLEPGLDRLLLNACQRHGIPPQQMELELTETALVHGLDKVAPLLHRLRSLGFSLALDDFGTGYSSLSYLRRLPFDKVKIDQSFVKDLAQDARAAQLLEGIVKMCHSLGMRTVAEGVETQVQLDTLLALGVQEFQGYLFARPVPVAVWLAQLQQGQLKLTPGPG